MGPLGRAVFHLAPSGKAPLAKVQDVVVAHCAERKLDEVSVSSRKDESTVRPLLGRVSKLLPGGTEPLVLVLSHKVYKCKVCDAVTCIKDMPPADDWGCDHCDSGCKEAAKTAQTTTKADPPYIRNLRVREEQAGQW